jgi:HD-like signal output (HDOD) protein
VNSAAYGIRQTVSNLQQAISLLGFNQIRNLALTASVSEVFKRDDPVGPYKRSGLWRHLVSVGICARLVARRCGIRSFEDAFLAGLLHDVGIVLLDQVAHPEFRRAMETLDASRTLCEVERDVFGFDHCQFGERIAEMWRFPTVARAAIRHHHASHRYDGEGADVVRCVEVANVLCSLKGVTSVGLKLLRPPLEAFQGLGFHKDDVVVLAHDVDREIADFKTLFEL